MDRNRARAQPLRADRVAASAVDMARRPNRDPAGAARVYRVLLASINPSGGVDRNRARAQPLRADRVAPSAVDAARRRNRDRAGAAVDRMHGVCASVNVPDGDCHVAGTVFVYGVDTGAARRYLSGEADADAPAGEVGAALACLLADQLFRVDRGACGTDDSGAWTQLLEFDSVMGFQIEHFLLAGGGCVGLRSQRHLQTLAGACFKPLRRSDVGAAASVFDDAGVGAGNRNAIWRRRTPLLRRSGLCQHPDRRNRQKQPGPSGKRRHARNHPGGLGQAAATNQPATPFTGNDSAAPGPLADLPLVLHQTTRHCEPSQQLQTMDKFHREGLHTAPSVSTPPQKNRHPESGKMAKRSTTASGH